MWNLLGFAAIVFIAVVVMNALIATDTRLDRLEGRDTLQFDCLWSPDCGRGGH
jgi:hypothetical protein